MLSLHRNNTSDPRNGRAKRVLTILVLAAAAGAARAQSTFVSPSPVSSSSPGGVAQAIASRLAAIAAPPLEKVATLGDIAVDEARLAPCTVADVAGEFARLAQTGVLQMEELPCEPWVEMTIADGFGDNEALAARAGAGAPTVAFALSPAEAAALRQSGVASGKAVSLNSLVSEVAVGPRTPGFGGSLGRVSRRTQDTVAGAASEIASSWTGSAEQRAQAERLKEAARRLDGGRPFPEEASYQPLAFTPNASAKRVEDLDPQGAIVILTASQPGSADPKPPNNGPVPTNPVSLDLRPGGSPGSKDAVLSVSGGGKLSTAPAEALVLRSPPVGGDATSPAVAVGSADAVARLTADQAVGR